MYALCENLQKVYLADFCKFLQKGTPLTQISAEILNFYRNLRRCRRFLQKSYLKSLQKSTPLLQKGYPSDFCSRNLKFLQKICRRRTLKELGLKAKLSIVRLKGLSLKCLSV
jgi:hypothetical protein